MDALPAAVRVNTPDIVAESVDGEVLIINLLTGVYFSTRGTGDAAWTLLASSCPLDVVSAALATHWQADPAQVAADVARFVADLLEHEVMLPAEPVKGDLPGLTGGPAAPWTAPALETFTDMQDLLMLDPVHEVADEGWPAPAIR